MKENNNVLKKIGITFAIIAFVGLVLYDTINKKENSYVSNTLEEESIINDNGLNIKVENKKQIRDNIDFNEQEISFNNLKQQLDINILTNKIYDTELVKIIKIEKNNDNIMYVSFSLGSIYESLNGNVSMAVEFITDNYPEDYFEVCIGSTEEVAYKSVEESEKFGIDLYFWSPNTVEDENEIVSTIIVVFIYDDVVYELQGTNVSKIELLNLINNLEYFN